MYFSGGLDLKTQEAALRSSPDVVVATPGRLIDHLHNSPSFSLSNIEVNSKAPILKFSLFFIVISSYVRQYFLLKSQASSFLESQQFSVVRRLTRKHLISAFSESVPAIIRPVFMLFPTKALKFYGCVVFHFLIS